MRKIIVRFTETGSLKEQSFATRPKFLERGQSVNIVDRHGKGMTCDVLLRASTDDDGNLLMTVTPTSRKGPSFLVVWNSREGKWIEFED
jgi:hypothetical protein